ncbi:hypothetical protein [Paenibacillus sp. 1P07SE]|uniref:hypothetical protein n=1 Tax=Paenibacillus sp. 1P07SE TaxID=3132209 RepID=UPI0039A5138E
MIQNLKRNALFYVLSLAVIVAVSWYFTSQSNAKSSTSSPAQHGMVSEDVISFDVLKTRYSGADEMDEKAGLIIRAIPTKEFADRDHVTTTFSDGEIQDFYTFTELTVTDILKKPDDLDLQSGDVFRVIETIGYNDPATKEQKITRNDYAEMQKDKEYIVFLHANSEGDYVVMNSNLGKFDLSGDQPAIDPSVKFTESEDHSQEEYQRYFAYIVEKYNLK